MRGIDHGNRTRLELHCGYACQAGRSPAFSFGDAIDTEQVNYDGNYPYGQGKKGEYRQRTVAVKQLPANGWGLYQMHGNVWEWCADRPRTYTEEAQSDPGLDQALAPQADDEESPRALRGGSWIFDAGDARSAYRYVDRPGGRDYLIGFRFALRSPSPASAPEARRPGGAPLRRDGADLAAGRSR